MSGYSQVIYLYKTVKTITELILGHKDKLEIKIVVHVLQTTRNLVVAVVVFFSLMTWVLQWPTEWGFRIWIKQSMLESFSVSYWCVSIMRASHYTAVVYSQHPEFVFNFSYYMLFRIWRLSRLLMSCDQMWSTWEAKPHQLSACPSPGQLMARLCLQVTQTTWSVCGKSLVFHKPCFIAEEFYNCKNKVIK